MTPRPRPPARARAVSILGSMVNLDPLDAILAKVDRWVSDRDGATHRIVVTGFHGLHEASRDRALQRILGSADLWVPDGIAPVWIARLRGHRGVMRIPGADLMEAVFKQGMAPGYRHAFYGDTDEVLEALRTRIETTWPGNVVVAAISPPFRELAPTELDAHIDTLNDARPDFLWVGLGMPKQDVWIYDHMHRLRVPVAAGVGAAFAFIAGAVERAPPWIGSVGLEWAYRLIKEPRKCWRRCFVDGPRFTAAICREQFGGRRAPRSRRNPRRSEAIGTPRALLLAVNCFPPTSPEAIVNAKLVRALQRRGWHVDVVARDNRATSAYPPSDRSAWNTVERATTFAPCISRGVEPRGARWPTRAAFALRRIASNLTWALSAYRIGLARARRASPDLLLSRSVPASAHLAAAFIAPRTRAPWVANWNDPEPWHMAPPPYGRGPRASLGRLWRLMLTLICRRVTWATFPSERLRRYMCGYLPGGLASRSSVIPHVGSDTTRSAAGPDPAVFSILHAGTLDAVRSPDVFLRGVGIFLARRPARGRTSICFMGQGGELVEEAAGRYGLRDVVHARGSLTYAASVAAMQEATILLMIEAPVEDGIFLPSKLLDYAGVERPILAVSPREGAVADALREYGGGVAADNQQAESVADALCELFDAWRAGDLTGRFVSAELSYAYRASAIVDAYTSLAAQLKVKLGGASDRVCSSRGSR